MSDERDSYRVRKSSGAYSTRGGRGSDYADSGRQVRRERDYRPPARRRPQPVMLRMLSWIGFILVCFAAGYLGTSWLMNWMNTKSLLKPDDRVRTFADFEALNDAKQASLSSSAGQLSATLYYVDGENIVNTVRDFPAVTQEDGMASSAESVMQLSGAGSSIKVLHVFRSGETVYLDMPGAFVSALSDAGQMKALRILTAIVRTMQDNFPPVVRVKFLVDSKTPEQGGIVDLSVPWQLPSR